MKLSPNALLWFFASVFLVGAVVYFFVTLQSLALLKTTNGQSAAPATNPASTSSSNYYGRLIKNPEPGSSGIGEPGLYGTHLLVNDDGNTSAYLESNKIDLKILEGSRVMIEGRRERMIGVGVPLISVEKVSFKLND